MLNQIDLAGKTIDYQLKYSRRTTIGLQINQRGLRVSAPLGVAVREIDAVLLSKAGWIHKKLAEWQNRKSLQVLNPARNAGVYPLLGDFWKPEMTVHGQIRMIPVSCHESSGEGGAENSPGEERLQKWIADWYWRQAVDCFSERINVFSGKLDIKKPSFKLSRARTRWGSCNSRGVIRLNWRLVQLPLHLVDYVVAHELCHLFEMNHSPAFWRRVETVCPDCQQARRELGEYTLRDS